jgi:hypothetical protein
MKGSNRVAAMLGVMLIAQGCARTARLDVVRPATLNAAPFGNSFEVRSFEGDPEGATLVQGALRERILASLNRAITLVERDGGLAVQGGIVRFQYDETEAREAEQCSHSETVNNQVRTVNHPCTRLIRRGVAQAAVTFSVVVPATGQVLFSRTYESSRRDERTGRAGPYPQDRIDPAPLDAVGLKTGAIRDVVDGFARVILPWRDTLELEFEGCGGDARCDRAYAALREQRLETAEGMYSTVIGAEGAPVPPPERPRVGDAYFNRAMVRMIRGNYGAAFIDLQRALELRPDRDAWRERYRALEELARDQDSLRAQQGLAPAQAAP